MKEEINTLLTNTNEHFRDKLSKSRQTVRWSEEDQVYIARVAEFPSLTAHGDSREDALRELQQVVNAVISEPETVEAIDND